MTFKCYVPYTQEEVNIIESYGGEIEEFYFSVEELVEYCGEVPYTEMVFDGIELEDINGDIISFDEIKEN